MIIMRILAVTLFWVVLSATSMKAEDLSKLSKYREFQFGTSLESLARQTSVKPSDAKTTHQRPALIQELEWQPQYGLRGTAPQLDFSRSLLFTFYDGKLFRIVVTYDRSSTEGLTDEDLIAAISAKYGTATRPTEKKIGFASSVYFAESERVIASWEDAEYSFNLIRSSYQPTVAMVLYAKQVHELADAAHVEALRLDALEAPQRELERQEAQEEEKRSALAKARLANKGTFRP